MSKWAWCLVKDDKTLATGWNKVGDYWYYLDKNGAMKTGRVQDPTNNKWYYLNYDGQMQTGWVKDNGKSYYFQEDGSMFVNGTTPDGYTVGSDGAWIDSLLSDAGAEFIGSWEGLYLKAYEDPYYPGNKSWWTIGYGTTYSVTPSAFPDGLNSKCTKEQAIGWLKDEAKNCAETIKADLNSKSIILSQNQLDALISFAYNCGTGALLGSTLYKNIVEGVRDSDTITSNFQAWSNANGVRSPGLFKRRNSESTLFLNSDYTGNV